MRVGILELAKCAVALEGLGELGDALSSVGAPAILDPAECIGRQTAAKGDKRQALSTAADAWSESEHMMHT